MLTTTCVEIPEPINQRPPDMMSEEASTGDTADNQPLNVNQLYTMTTTDYVESERPAPRRVLVEVAEEASTDDTTNEQCMYEVLDNNKTTDRKLSMNCSKYLSSWSREGSWNWPRRPGNWGGKEAVFSCGGSSTTAYQNEVHCEGAARVPTVKFEAGQLMQWPDIKSDGVMIRGIMLESEMSPIGSVRHAAEPVFVSEMLTLVFAGGGGGVVAAAAPWLRQSHREFLSYRWLEVIF